MSVWSLATLGPRRVPGTGPIDGSPGDVEAWIPVRSAPWCRVVPLGCADLNPRSPSGPWSLGAPGGFSYVVLVQLHTTMRRAADEAISAQIFGGDHQRVMAVATGRVCKYEGCSTRLSMYNYGWRCAAHDRLSALIPHHSVPTPTRKTVPHLP